MQSEREKGRQRTGNGHGDLLNAKEAELIPIKNERESTPSTRDEGEELFLGLDGDWVGHGLARKRVQMSAVNYGGEGVNWSPPNQLLPSSDQPLRLLFLIKNPLKA